MTRINLVDPALLVNQHLMAEYKESPRIYSYVRAAIQRGETVQQARTLSPPHYVLGTGHCRFFYTRLGWLAVRGRLLVDELLRRNYRINYHAPPDWVWDIPAPWFGDWQPDPAAVALSINRINYRLGEMGQSEHKIHLDSVI